MDVCVFFKEAPFMYIITLTVPFDWKVKLYGRSGYIHLHNLSRLVIDYSPDFIIVNVRYKSFIAIRKTVFLEENAQM